MTKLIGIIFENKTLKMFKPMKAKQIISTLLIATLGGMIALGVNAKLTKKTIGFSDSGIGIPAHFASYTQRNQGGYPDFRYAAQLSVHAVVHIKTSFQQKNTYYDEYFGFDPFRDFFDNPFQKRQIQPEKIQAAGSGVIISEDGYIVTNNHVVAEAEEIEVILNDKRSFNAKIIGTDPTTDLAVLKIDEKNLPFLIYGNSDSLAIGEWVLAVGNPFNLTSTVTAGIVSAKARNINILGGGVSIESFIQTDAAVNPGNSGGALVNTKGELVGINAAIASNTGSYAGYSFAIPVNIVKKIIDDLLNYNEVQRAFIGVEIREIDSQFAHEKNLKDVSGVYVLKLTDKGAAADAGIQTGDVILKIDGADINTSSQLLEIVGQHRPGDKITLTINRDNEIKKIDVVLKNKNGDTGIITKVETNIISMLGATFETINDQEKKKLRVEYGVKITDLKPGKLSNSGIRKGFIITHIDKKPIRSTDDIKDALEGKNGGVLFEGVYPNGMRAYYGFGL